ncbi:MAG: class I SAM-dependent methyltransferase [Rhodospirillaceae bacterium]|nr:class I SAM-dependent methyltransferase [Rhodospirillaceae bacterium]
MNQGQSAISRYREIIKYHGLLRGLRRVFDQIAEVDFYDSIHATNTRQILSGGDFLTGLSDVDAAAAMHYQPVYTSAVRKPLRHLVASYPILGASSTCFLDLGCGRGKALHVARSMLQHATLIGMDLHPALLKDAARNLGLTGPTNGARLARGDVIDAPKIKLICNDVNAVDYAALLASFDVIVAFNKNSFDLATTERTLRLLRSAAGAKKWLFYVYSNPVFEHLFAGDHCVFTMTGWHKNWNTKVFLRTPAALIG